MRCDAKTFAQMYEQIYVDLYRFAVCRMGDVHDAEDAVSEAVIAAYENIRKLRNPEAFKSWIFTILANVCKKKLKKRSMEQRQAVQQEERNSEGTLFQEEMAAPLADPGEMLDVRRAFFVLSEEEQEIVGLSVFGGYNSQEIGKMLKLNPATVRSKRSRALKKMAYVLS